MTQLLCMTTNRGCYRASCDPLPPLGLTTIKKVVGEGHACDRPLKSITNVTYGDDLSKIIVVSVYSDGPLRFVTKAIFNETFGEGH